MSLLKFFANNGYCDTIVTDGGPPFNSHQFSSFCSTKGMKHILAPAYHPQSNGIAEKGVQIFKNFAKKFLFDFPNATHTDFMKGIYQFLLAYKNTPISIIGKTPAELFLKSKCNERVLSGASYFCKSSSKFSL
jgi:transposase InsO family protein